MNPETRQRGELVRPAAESAGPARMLQASRIPPDSRAIAAVPAAPVGVVTPMGLLRALRRRSALALGAALLLAIVAAPAAWLLVPVTYKAQARLLIAEHAPQVLYKTLENENTSGEAYKRYQNTQQTLVKTDMVLSAALRDPKVARSRMLREQQDDPIAWLQGKLAVQFLQGSEVMEIALAGPEPQEVSDIVNAVKKAYMDEVVNKDQKRRTDRYDQITKLRDTYNGLLKKKRELMRKLAESAGSNDKATLALKQQYVMEQQQSLLKELQEIRSQKRMLEARLKLARQGPATEPTAEPPPLSEEEVDRLVDGHPSVSGLVDELAERQQELDTAQTHAARVSRSPQAEPAVRSLRVMVAELSRTLARRRKEVRPEVIRQAREDVVVGEASQGSGLDRELATLAEVEQSLNQELGAIKLVHQSLASDTLDLEALRDDLVQTEQVATRATQEAEALKVELEARPRIQSWDDATLPRTRDDKKRYMMVAMATLGSFFAGLLGIAFLELQTRKVDSADEVPVELGLPVVGALPILPARSHRPAAIAGRENDKDRYWRNVLLESVDATRTLLLHAARTGSYQMMMITSAVGGEGKTSLASYLGTSLARAGLRTLLIDADLRSPMLHNLFDRPPAPGLSELLRGELGLEEALAETAVPDLTLLAAGKCDRQALRALSQGGAGPVFDRLRERFDFIIVDTSPILPVADGMMIAQQVDAAIFSIFRDVSRKGKIKMACDRLLRLGVPVLGAVVTGAHGGNYGNDHYDADSSYRGLPESVAAGSTDLS